MHNTQLSDSIDPAVGSEDECRGKAREALSIVAENSWVLRCLQITIPSLIDQDREQIGGFGLISYYKK